MFITPFERVKNLMGKINELENKLMNASFMPMAEQKKIHEEIKKYKAEMELLERRTKPK
jgi:hypothetical protein